MGANKILMLGTLFSLLFILLSPLASAGITHEGDKIIYENQYGRISVYPENVSSPVKKFEQYINLTSKLGQDRDMDFAMSFDSPIVDYNLFLRKAYNRSIPTYANTTIYPIFDSGNETCSVLGYQDYNSTNCRTWAILQNGTGLEEDYKWNNINLAHTHKTNLLGEGKHWYITEDITFKAYSNKYVKWIYETAEPSGKWFLYMKPSDKTWAEAEAQGVLFIIDPYWNIDYGGKWAINMTNNNDTYEIPVNYTWIYEMNHKQWVLDGNGSLENGDDVRIVCNDVEMDRINETGEWNSTSVNISYSSPFSIPADFYNDTDGCYIYSDNLGAGVPPTNTDNIYQNFYDDFEDGDVSDWGTYGLPPEPSTKYVTQGSWSMNLNHSAVGGQNVNKTFRKANPRYFQWNIYFDHTNQDIYLYFAICGGTEPIGELTCGDSQKAVGFRMGGGTLHRYEGVSLIVVQSVSSNIWYRIEAKDINYTSHTYDLYVDGVLKKINAPFTNTTLNEANYSQIEPDGNRIRQFYIDFLVGKEYIYPEPTITLGAKETPPPINTTPIVYLYNATGSTTDTTPSIDFNFTDDDLSATCYLLLNGTAYDVNTATINATRTTLTANATLSFGDYEVNVSCYDGQATGTSSPITLTIIPLPYLYITINSPENKTYSSLSTKLNVSINTSHNVDRAFYELNGINYTLNNIGRINDDTEDAYSCLGSFAGGFPCSNSVDENWTTYSKASPNTWANIFENFTIPTLTEFIGANFTFSVNFYGGIGAGLLKISIWNYSKNDWDNIYTIDEFPAYGYFNYTIEIPAEALNGSILQLNIAEKSRISVDYVGYVEGMVTWFNKTYSKEISKIITVQEGSNDLTAYVNNTYGILNSSRVVFSVTISPSIDQVNVPSASLDPVEKSTTNVAINFTATGTYLDNTSAKFVLSKGVTSYTDTVCEVTAIDSNTNRYNCDINLNYYDIAGVWTVNVSIDNSTADGLVYDDSKSITYNSLTALQTNSSSLSFGTFNRAGSPIIDTNQLENTGNVNITTITVTGYDLIGVTDPSQFLYLSNSIFAVRQEGENYSDLINATQVTVTNGVLDLYPSQYTNLDFKITPANIPAINKAQVYQTETGLEWIISV